VQTSNSLTALHRNLARGRRRRCGYYPPPPSKGHIAPHRGPAPPNVLIRRETLSGKLPKEDPHLHRDGDPPEVAEVLASGTLIELKVE
jgi:hypothetical protein